MLIARHMQATLAQLCCRSMVSSFRIGKNLQMIFRKQRRITQLPGTGRFTLLSGTLLFFPTHFPLLSSRGMFSHQEFRLNPVARIKKSGLLAVDYLGSNLCWPLIPFPLWSILVLILCFQNCTFQVAVIIHLSCHCLNDYNFFPEDLLPSHWGVISAKQKQTN